MHTLDTNQIHALSRLFSSSVLQEMARHGKSPILKRLILESSILDLTLEIRNLGDLFDQAFAFLKKKHLRHEYIYKAALTHKILIGTHKLKASMLTEFRVGKCKADIVILNGTGTVYEIKSERDSLSRLMNQMEAYMKVFAKVNVIVGENHLEAVKRLLSEEIGILMLSDRYQITEVRPGLNMPERTCPEAIFNSLQMREAKRILEHQGIEIPSVPNTQLYEVLREKFIHLSPIVAHHGMVDTLKVTRSIVSLESLVKDVPASLQAAVLSTPIRKQDYGRLLELLKIPVQDALLWA